MKVTTLQESLKKHLGTSLYSNAYYLMATQVVASLGGFAFWVIAARFFTAEDVGLAGAIIPAISLLAAISELGLGYGLIRFLPGAGNKANKMLNTSFTLYFLASMVASLIFLFGLGLWSPALLTLRSHPAYFAGFVAFVVVSGLRALVNTVFIAYLSSKFTSIMALITRLSAIPLLILFMSLLHDFSGIVAALGFAIMICLLVAVVFFLPRVNKGYFPYPQISKGVIKQIIPYSIGNHISLFIGAAITWLLPIIVINILGAEANAYFYIAWAVSLMVMVIPSALSTSAFAESSHHEESLLPNIGKALKLSILLQLPVIALIFAFGDELLLLFGKEYSESGTTVLWLLSLTVLPSNICHFYGTYARVKANFKILIGLAVAITTLVLSLTYFLAPRFGIEGVGVAYLAGHTLLALGIIALVLHKKPRKKLALIWRGR